MVSNLSPQFGQLGPKSAPALSSALYDRQTPLIEALAGDVKYQLDAFTKGEQLPLAEIDSGLRKLTPDDPDHQGDTGRHGSAYDDLKADGDPANVRAMADVILANTEEALANVPLDTLKRAAVQLRDLPGDITPEMDQLVATALRHALPGASPPYQETHEYRDALRSKEAITEPLQEARTFVKDIWDNASLSEA